MIKLNINMYHYLLSNLVLVAMLILFYYYAKKLIFKTAPRIAEKFSLIQTHPFNQVVGVIELVIVAICHVFFCAFLLWCFNIDVNLLYTNTTLLDCFYGVLIGIGSVGFSISLCVAAMKCLEKIAKNKVPQSFDGWMAVSSAGWIRHHKHTVKILPLYVAIVIITLQVGAEETIFRAVLLNVFMPYGVIASFLISTILFIVMQIFHMPSMISALFPILGAVVMGITHGILYLINPSVVPLIISHVTFFIFTVI